MPSTPIPPFRYLPWGYSSIWNHLYQISGQVIPAIGKSRSRYREKRGRLEKNPPPRITIAKSLIINQIIFLNQILKNIH